MSWTFLPLIPPWLIALVTLGLIALLAQGCLVLLGKKVTRRWVAWLALLRLLAIVVFTLLLCRPIVSYRHRVQQRPGLMVLLDTSKSMAQQTQAGDAGRLRLTLDKLAAAGLPQQLTEGFDTHWYGFNRDAYPLAEDELKTLEARGKSTQLADSLATAWAYQAQLAARTSGQALPPARLLLISDGNDQGADVLALARDLGLTVDVLPPGPRINPPLPPRVVIAGLQSPSRVLLGSQARFLASVRQESAAGVPLVARLSEDGRPVAEQEFSFTAEQSERLLTLVHTPVAVGAKRYSLTVGPRQAAASQPAASQPAAGDLLSAPPYEVNVRVVGQAAQVLLLEDSWRWDFKFLRRLLEVDPSFSFTSFLSRGTGTYLQFAEPERTVKLAQFPRSSAELEWFDIIILGDVTPQRWPESLAPALRRMVTHEGKSLVVIAGPGLGQLLADPALGGLLPVELSPASAQPVMGPIQVRVTPEGLASAFFHNPGADEKTSPWSELPALDQIYRPVRKKPGATVLLDSPAHGNEFGPAIVMAEQTVGKGRVLFIGTDTLWKWQMLGVSDKAGVTPYQVVHQQALRAMAPRSWTRTNLALSLAPERSRYWAGDSVKLSARLKANPPLRRPEMQAKVTLPDGQELPLALSADAAEPGLYRADFEVARSGAYKVSASVAQDGVSVADATCLIETQAGTGETEPLPINLAVLENLAAATGGKVLELDNRATWPVAGSQPPQILAAGALDLWNAWVLLLLLTLLLGLDWLLRLLRGFV